MTHDSITLAAGVRHDLASKAGRTVARLLPTKLRTARRVPLVSFTFDDIPDTALDNGARLLDVHGARGTFYVAGQLCGRRDGELRFAAAESLPALVDEGHEIGCHTFSHPDLQRRTPAKLAAELDANAAFLGGHLPRLRLSNFAYPYGSTSFAQKRIVQRRFRSARGVRHGINRRLLDLGQLLAVQLYDTQLDGEGLDRLLAETAAAGGWLIFYTHDVADRPSPQGCSPRLLALALAASKRHGCPVMTVEAALDVKLGRDAIA